MTSGIFLTSDSSLKLKDSILAMIFVMINGCNSFLAFEALIGESKDLELFVGFPIIFSIKSASSLTLKLCFFIILQSVVSTNQTRGIFNIRSNCPNGNVTLLTIWKPASSWVFKALSSDLFQILEQIFRQLFPLLQWPQHNFFPEYSILGFFFGPFPFFDRGILYL